MADNSDFIATYGPLAQDIADQTKLDSSVVLGQMALETGWGKQVSGNNLFGISPGGKLASYQDAPTAGQAYVDLINSKYAPATKLTDPDAQANAIPKLGYNTADPAYGTKLASIASGLRAQGYGGQQQQPQVQPQPTQTDTPVITSVNAAGHDFSVNAKYADKFTGFIEDLAKTGYKINDVQGYNNRTIAGSPTMSYHASGAAIDVNPSANPVNGRTDLPDNIGDIAARHGLGWGGAWTGGKKDPMHFSIAKEEGGSEDIPHLKPGQPVTFAPKGQPAVAPPSAQPAQSGPSDDDLYKQLTGSPTPPPATSTQKAETPPATDEELYHQLTASAPATTTSQPPPANAPAVDALFPGDSGLRSILAPEPNTTYGSVLPFAKDDKTGDVRLALPSALRSLATGALDLTQGPKGMVIGPSGSPILSTDATGALMMKPTESVASGTGKAVAEAVDNKLLQRAAPLSDDFKANPLAPGALDNIKTQAPADSSPIPNAPPQSTVGAKQVETTPPDLTPGQASTYNKNRLDPKNNVLQSAKNDAEYIPGVTTTSTVKDPYGISNPNAPKANQVTNAVAEKNQSAIDADFKSKLDAQNAENLRVRKDYHLDTTGDGISIENAEAARDQFKPDFTSQTAVTKAQSVPDLIDKIMASPEGKQDAVANAMAKIKSKLYDADGNLETMPDQLYGVRKQITNMMSKIGQQADPTLKLATGQLNDVKTALDSVISSGAPNFPDYLKNWSEASRPIDAMKQLQSYDITDKLGNLQYNKVQAMMSDIVKKQAAPGVNPAKSISPDQMDRLWNLRDDLARENNKDQIARTKGSDTTQMLNASGAIGSGPIAGAVKGMAKFGAEAALHAALGAKTFGVGNALYSAGKHFYTANKLTRDAATATAAREAMKNRLLSP